ncbi:MAG: radical SAM family heme chaperone HemW, partial [Pirellulales bacterium]
IGQVTMVHPVPRAAYVHVPFCRHRCGYCNFTLVAGRDDLVDDYLRAIAIELRALDHPREVDTLFFGGGTPTHLAPAALEKLLEIVRAWFPLSAGGEFSVEANPLDVTDEKVSLLAAAGVNRLSLGGQSFDAAKLALLERDHDAAQLRRAFALARRQMRSVSLDLIFGTPGDTLENWRLDLAAALALAPDHVSTYGLTFEQGTPFWNRLEAGELARLDEETERAMYELAIDTLAAAGFEHYEVSNFARPGHRCRHNEVYWSGEPYFAVGPGAARYVDGRRETNHRSTTTWLNRVLAGNSGVAESEALAPEDRAREFLVFALRRLEGIDRGHFAERTGFDVDRLVGEPLERMVALDLLQDDGRRIKLSRQGLFVSDSIWPHFLRR